MSIKLLDLMSIEIKKAGKPLTIREALTSAEKDGIINELEKLGKTPQNSINALLHKDMAKSEPTFTQVSARPARFDLIKK